MLNLRPGLSGGAEYGRSAPAYRSRTDLKQVALGGGLCVHSSSAELTLVRQLTAFRSWQGLGRSGIIGILNATGGVTMERAKLLRLGGYAAGVVLIGFGIATIAIGIAGKSTVEDELSQEKIVGSPDMSPEGIAPGIAEAKLTVDAPDCDVAEEPITTGSEARCFARYMRIHALESSGGLTYAEMGRYVSESDPSNPAGTNDEAAALKDESGKPVSNGARNTWVTETALSTALNVSYMATGVAVFAIVVGVALILAGVGFLLLAAAVFRGASREAEPA
jgi:hypothetical protein